jgi:hypothetical protein
VGEAGGMRRWGGARGMAMGHRGATEPPQPTLRRLDGKVGAVRGCVGDPSAQPPLTIFEAVGLWALVVAQKRAGSGCE